MERVTLSNSSREETMARAELEAQKNDFDFIAYIRDNIGHPTYGAERKAWRTHGYRECL